jgi:hypothetical protein
VALCSAGALDAGKPIEEPQTDRASDVKNHLADLDFDLSVWSGCGCRCHRVSFSLKGIWGKYVKLDQALS